MKFPSEFSWRHLPAYACTDIQWWLSYTQAWNSVQILDQQKPTLYIYTDTSSLKGLGGMIGEKWFSTLCPHQFQNRDIQFKEIYVVLQAILQWGLDWEGHHVVFHMENTVIVASIGPGTSRNPQVTN